jgi:putative sigma-54 modulation protein
MTIEYTGRQTEVSPEVRRFAEKKLSKLQKVLPRITRVHVILTSDKRRQIAEVSVHSRSLDLTAAEETGDLLTSLATVIEKLTRQAQRHMGKLKERKRRAPTRSGSLWSGVLAPAPAGEAPRVIRSRRFVAKPMTVDEAALEMGSGESGFVVFRDASSERLSVLYRRKDGNLGLIEPEA